MDQQRIDELIAIYRDGLLGDTLPFWLPRSVDQKHGGFMTARDRDGSILDTDKGVWQQGRFEGDIEFWESGLAQTESVKPVKRGECLRFFLDKENDFRFFHNVATQELQSANWLVDTAPEELQDTDEN